MLTANDGILDLLAGHRTEVASSLPHPQCAECSPPRLDELLGTVAHELRSPLVAIVDAAHMIANECDLEPLARRALALMERQSRHGLRMIDDLFDICAGTGGKLS